MRGFFGPLEWMILGIVVVLGLAYHGLTQAFPEYVAPELRMLQEDPAYSGDDKPRYGRVVPSESYRAFLGQQDSELAHDAFIPRREVINQIDLHQISYFAQGTDGLPHPASSFLKNFVPFRTDKDWVPLTAVAMRVRYMRDDASSSGSGVDIWQTSPQTYKGMWGDCEDFAILLADWMIGLGYDARVVGGTVDGEGHAWVVFEKEGEEYLLESTGKGSKRRFPLTRLHPEYVPVFMFDRQHFWLRNEKRPYQFSEPEDAWIHLSDFNEDPAPVMQRNR